MSDEFVQLSDEERGGMLRDLTENVTDYPVIPTFKQEEMIVVSLEHGNVDFIAFTWDYQGDVSATGRTDQTTVTRAEPWSYATLGFAIRAGSIPDAMAVVREIVEGEHTQHAFIYFRLETPDIPSPRRSYVDIALEVMEATKQELQQGNTIRRLFYDI